MKIILFNLVLTIILSSSITFAQTQGILTFTFTEIPKTPTYNGSNQHALALWIQSSTGAFIKTKLAYAGCCATCGNTQDHVPTWSANAGGLSSDCLNANVVDATTGATASAWKTYTVSWDGKKGAAATGTLQPDGIYKVSIQSTWSHAGTGTALTSYTFTKGPNVDHQTPNASTTFSNITLNWQPITTTGLNEASINNPEINVYPNPTNGVFNVDFKNANNIKVFNMLGIVVYETKVEQETEGTKNIDLSSFADGIYFINVSNTSGSLNHKVILDK